MHAMYLWITDNIFVWEIISSHHTIKVITLLFIVELTNSISWTTVAWKWYYWVINVLYSEFLLTNTCNVAYYTCTCTYRVIMLYYYVISIYGPYLFVVRLAWQECPLSFYKALYVYTRTCTCTYKCFPFKKLYTCMYMYMYIHT